MTVVRASHPEVCRLIVFRASHLEVCRLIVFRARNSTNFSSGSWDQ